MRLAGILCCVLLMAFCAGCGSGGQCAEIPEKLPVTAEPAAAISEMLLHTDETLQIRIDPHIPWEPGVWLQDAADSQVLARTMVQTVAWSRVQDILRVQASYAKPQAILRKEKQKLTESAKVWCASTAGEPPEIRVLLAHDLLCRSCQYDDTVPDCHAAAGALFGHSAACDGYAEGFALLLETAGIPVRIVTGIACRQDGAAVSHAWNLVQISGSWYHVDCTWDDTGTEPDHSFFLLDDEQAGRTHIWDAKKYPPAQGGGYRYEAIAAEMASGIRKAADGYTG